MTQPIDGDTPATPETPTTPDALGLAFCLTQGPDGRTWPTWQFRTLTMTVAVQLPPENAETIAEAVLAETRAVSRQARRVNRQAIAGIEPATMQDIRALTPKPRRH